jgi:alpha-glucosidase (family GH31 glycosyl hydrolase)
MQADMLYVGQKPVEEVTLHVWTGPDSSFTLYEDDGISLAHDAGEVAATRIDAKRAGGSMTVKVGLRSGSYAGMPETRSYKTVIHGVKRLTSSGTATSPARRGR